MKQLFLRTAVCMAMVLSLAALMACGTSSSTDDSNGNGTPTQPGPGPVKFGPAGVDMSKDPAVPYGGMTFSWGSAGFDYSNLSPPHWIVHAYEGYLEFTWTGRYFFNHRSLGTLWTDGWPYTWIDIYVNGQLHAWDIPVKQADWDIFTIPDYYFTEGVNTVRLVLVDSPVYGFRTFLLSDHAWVSTRHP